MEEVSVEEFKLFKEKMDNFITKDAETFYFRNLMEAIHDSNYMNEVNSVMEYVRKERTAKEIDELFQMLRAKAEGQFKLRDTTEDYVYALIKEDGGWSVSPDGITECIEFDVPMNKEKELNLNLVKEAVQFDGVLIRVNLYNDTSNSYVFGTTDEKTEIIVETTEGTFTSIVEEPQKIEKKARNYFIAKIENLKGDITKVTVTSVFDVDKDGNAILDTKKDITAYSK